MLDEIAALYEERVEELDQITDLLTEGVAAAIAIFDEALAEYTDGLTLAELQQSINDGALTDLIYASGVQVVLELAVTQIVESAGGLLAGLELGGLSGVLESVELYTIADTYITSAVNGIVGDVVKHASRKVTSEVVTQVTRDSLDTLTAAHKLELETAVRSVDRAALAQVDNALKENGADVVYLYVGARDSVTRASCNVAVDVVFTRAQLASMDNGQINPVFVYLGGYNCRHGLAMMLRSVAVREGLTFATAATIAAFNNAGRKRPSKRKRKK